MDSIPGPDCGQGNPDISGIGVRLSFYLQNFLLVLLVDRSWEDAPSALWTFTSTSFGLTVAAIVQSQQAQLSFFQAIQVTNLVWLANFGSFLALASYSRHRTIKDEEQKISSWEEPEAAPNRRGDTKPKPNNLVKLGAMTQMFFSMALTLITWARPDIFSNDSGDATDTCDVKYVAFFGANFPARGSGRVLGLTVTCLLLVGYLLVTMHELRTYYTRNKKRAERKKRKEEENMMPVMMPTPAFVITEAPDKVLEVTAQIQEPSLPPSPFLLADSQMGSIRTTQSHGDEPVRERRKPHSSRADDHRSRRANWGTDLDPMLLGLTIFQVIVFTYFIVCTELLLKRNPASDNLDQQWGFGQILALIVVVPSLISVIQAFREHKFGNLHHSKSKGNPRAKSMKRKRRSLSV